MSNLTSGLAPARRRKSGLSLIAAAISLAIIAGSATILYRLFREIEIGEVVAALKNTAPHSLLAACGFVVAGYVMLACYDLFALRAIGCKTIPRRIAAFASFISYTIGHNCGATVFTSGLIRYRIYSAWGLTIPDIARIAFITGLTYCLGNALLLGGGLLLAPDAASAIDRLPASLNILIGLIALAALGGYLLWLLPCRRIVGRSNWRVVLPGPSSTLVQTAIGALDLAFVTLAMYCVLPASPAIGILDVLVIFVTAMLIGVVSYVPGSLGVIEAAMLVGLPQFRKEDLLASLLTFRVIYFVLPLLLAVCLLGFRECRGVLAGLGRAA